MSIRAVAEAAINVPGTTAVIGYDDVTLAAHTSPSPTMVYQNLAVGAELMIDRLLKCIAEKPVRRAMVAPVLVAHSSHDHSQSIA